MQDIELEWISQQLFGFDSGRRVLHEAEEDWEVQVTNDRPWRLANLSFVPSGNGRERATINGVEVVRENGRYWIITPSGPIWSNIDERGVDPALQYLFGKKQQQEQSSQ